MRRMQNSNVLIIGLKGLGLEIAKNVILAGVKSVTIWDCSSVELSDLSAQYYLKEEHVGKRRDECSLSQLADLNTYVPVRILDTQAVKVGEIDCGRELADKIRFPKQNICTHLIRLFELKHQMLGDFY